MRRPLPLALAAALLCCDPPADEQPWLLASPRLLAAPSEPAEAAPGEGVALSAFVLGPQGPAPAPVLWGRCASRKPLTELGPVDPDCLRQAPGSWVPLGQGPGTSLTVPADACRLFGPDRPDPKPGEPAGRPVDPDASGGYYLPLALDLGAERSTASVRIKCDLSGATQQAVISFGKLYQPNHNPRVAALTLSGEQGALETPEAAPLRLPRGKVFRLSARFPSCPAVASCGDGVCSPGEQASECAADCQPARGCQGAEPYAHYDPATQRVELRRESLRASWYATGGVLGDSATAPLSPDETTVDTSFQTPTPGTLWLAVVLRDDRGGAGVRAAQIIVE